MGYPIEDIEGIGPANADKLSKAGITKTGDLLNKCAAPTGRKNVAETTGLSEAVVLTQKKLTRQVASASQVKKWVEQAKVPEPILTY